MIQTWTCRLCGGHLITWDVDSKTFSSEYRKEITNYVTHHLHTHHFNELIEVTTKEDDNEKG